MAHRIALTGASGFIGRRLVPKLLAAGHDVRVLARDPSALSLPVAVEVVEGDLANEAGLDTLCAGRDVVIHLAGLVQATRPAAFREVNAEGARRVAAAAAKAGAEHVVLASSLAARAPEASRYAASKRAGEDAVAAVIEASRLTVIRPPAVYGPGDRATLPIFQQLARGVIFVPAGRRGPKPPRFSLIHVDDLAELFATVAAGPPQPGRIEPDDGHVDGYDWRVLAAIGSEVIGRPVRVREVPGWIAAPAALLCDAIAGTIGRPLPLSTDKLRELRYPDWVARGHVQADWTPRIDFANGLRTTLQWYHEAGWL